MRRLCFEHGTGYRASPLRADLRRLLRDRITELGKKAWPCFKAPTEEQTAQVESTTKLEQMLIDLEEGGRREETTYCEKVQPSRIVHAQSSSEAQEHARPHNPRDGDGASASCVGEVQCVSGSCTGDVQGTGGSRSATVLFDTSDAFGPATRGGNEAANDDGDDDDADANDDAYGADLREQPGDDGDSFDEEILESLRNDEEDVYTYQMSRMFISVVSRYPAVDDVVIDSMAQCQAVERHFTSCFKFPELVGFVLAPRFHTVDKLPLKYANQQAINIFGIDATKTFHQPYTFWGMMRAVGFVAKVLLSRSESWVVHSQFKMPFNVFDENGAPVIRFQDVWGTIELFSNECFPVCFSPAGENELLRQPGPVKGLPANDSPATA
jgi:hypothetical protein